MQELYILIYSYISKLNDGNLVLSNRITLTVPEVLLALDQFRSYNLSCLSNDFLDILTVDTKIISQSVILSSTEFTNMKFPALLFHCGALNSMKRLSPRAPLQVCSI